mmetsp:Transcript_8177/g.20555  ORF Transcript_8177/g.20555 Transcript_8177/m.20555 type:complete len:241 (+) Transcript_8177:771-1493(+)
MIGSMTASSHASDACERPDRAPDANSPSASSCNSRAKTWPTRGHLRTNKSMSVCNRSNTPSYLHSFDISSAVSVGLPPMLRTSGDLPSGSCSLSLRASPRSAPVTFVVTSEETLTASSNVSRNRCLSASLRTQAGVSGPRGGSDEGDAAASLRLLSVGEASVPTDGCKSSGTTRPDGLLRTQRPILGLRSASCAMISWRCPSASPRCAANKAAICASVASSAIGRKKQHKTSEGAPTNRS